MTLKFQLPLLSRNKYQISYIYWVIYLQVLKEKNFKKIHSYVKLKLAAYPDFLRYGLASRSSTSLIPWDRCLGFEAKFYALECLWKAEHTGR